MTFRPPNTTGLIRRTERYSDGLEGQAWPPQPPAAGFNPATGFPWNRDDGERFVQQQFWPDDTPAPFVGVPLNATAKTAWSDDTAEAFVPSTFVADDTPAALGIPPLNVALDAWNVDQGERFVVDGVRPDDTPAVLGTPPLNVTQLTAWAVEGGEVLAQPTDDPTSQSWAVGPPLNVTALTAFNGDSDVPPNVTTEDPSVQSWAVQIIGAVAPFDPSTGFPWEQDQGERFVPDAFVADDTVPPFVGSPLNAAQKVAFDGDASETLAVAGDDPSVQSWAVGTPLNAVSAQAFNQPDEASFAPVADDTAQPYSIQPPVAAAFDPSTGFPWPKSDDIVQPVWAIADDTSQAWTPQTPGVPFIVSSQDITVPEAWVIDAIASPSWIAAQGAVAAVYGGQGPNSASATAGAPTGSATNSAPSGDVTAAAPIGTASHPSPQR